MLQVPDIRQQENSQDCGPAGLLMVLKFYGINMSIEEMKKEIQVDPSIGTYIPQLGAYMIDMGFDVEIITRHPLLFSLDEVENNPIDMYAYFIENKECLKLDSDIEKENYAWFLEFLRKGGNIRADTPKLEYIQEEIANGRPLCVNLTADAIAERKTGFTFHFNVITGYDKEYIYVNDPHWECGGRIYHRHEDFFYSTYATAYGGIDNACFMLIKKKD